MRVLVLHSRYLSGAVSGENRVVDAEVALLRDAGHTVHAWMPSVDAPRGLELARIGAQAVWSRHAADSVTAMIREHTPDIVHVHNLYPALSPSVIRAARYEGAAVVMSLHNYRLACIAGTLVRDGRACTLCVGRTPAAGVRYRCYRGSAAASGALAMSLMVHRTAGTFRLISRFLAVSEYVRRMMTTAGLPPRRIVVKRHSSPQVAPRRGPGGAFLFLGRLSPEKGLRTLVEVWRRRSPGRLVIVGDGPMRARLANALPADVRLLGAVSPEAVPALLRGARALLVPSIGPETGSLATVEAFAAGVPVLASEVGGLTEIVEHDVSGMLLPPGDVDAWADAIAALGDDGVSSRLGQGAEAGWRARFTPQKALARLESAYEAAARL